MRRFLLISPKNRTAYNFRGELITQIRQGGYEVIVTGPNREHIDKIEALGARFIEIPMNKNGINPLADLKYTFQLYELMRKERPVCTLGYTIKPVIYGAIAAKLAGVGNINSMITGAGYLFISESRKARMLKRISFLLYRIGLACAHKVIFQNPDDRKEFTAHKLVSPEKCHVVNGSGVNMRKFHPSPLPSTITFFMLGRLLYSKGAMEYLKAAEIIKARYPRVRFMLLGNIVTDMQDGIKAQEIEPYLDNGIVELLGETDHVIPYYNQCSVFVLPSYREGTPRSVLEAMAMGRPIITTDTQGCRETVVDGENGYLVPIKDPVAVASAMERFILNPQSIDSMGKKSLALCEEKFEVSKVNADMIEIMEL